ncbi:uncharacterized protein LOC130897033 isoform X2 [Diorhabda carinulata]|uniref:uncharacterized protein LOC130897033 isoform X2 n=1 Tax=Diorhabda carinulata TaxID=1163345 RepID=UPI0025A008C1|nr:uncharacterized protein LOC130897033 isoform X2 [Diorhabda carinulata]
MSPWVLVPVFFVLGVCLIVIIYAICMGCSGYKPFQSKENQTHQQDTKPSSNERPSYYHEDNEYNHHFERHSSNSDDAESVRLNDDVSKKHDDTEHTVSTDVAVNIASGFTELTSFAGGNTGGDSHVSFSHHSTEVGNESSHISTPGDTFGGSTYDSGGGGTSNDAGGSSYIE